MAASAREIALVYGGQHIGKGITRAMEYVDTLYPGAVLGQDPSLLVDIVGAVGGILGGLYLRDPFDTLALLIGGYLSTDLWRHAEKMASRTATAFVPAAVSAPVTVVGTPAPAPAPKAAPVF